MWAVYCVTVKEYDHTNSGSVVYYTPRADLAQPAATRAAMPKTQDQIKPERKLSHRADWLRVGVMTSGEHLPSKGDAGFHLALQKKVKSGGQENKSYRRPLLTNVGALRSRPWEHSQK